jgi:hypothetical protein
MIRSFFALTTGAVLLALGAQANASSFGDLYDEFQRARAEGRAGISLDIDNDSLLLNKRDGFYTSGARVTRDYWLRDAAQAIGYGWRIGQELYTASDIKLPPALISPQDHPYAAWLYAGAFKENYRSDGFRYKFGMDIGCIGPCANGEWTQTTLHKIIRQPLPQGWDEQVRNEWGIVIYGDVTPARWNFGRSFDLAPNIHGRFGNIFTDAGIGLTLRAGQLNLLPHQPSLHGYVRLDADAIGYNATLQGGYFSTDNPHTVKPKRFAGEAEVGLVWNRGTWGVSASVIRRSNEIRGLPNGLGAQNYARLQFSYTP